MSSPAFETFFAQLLMDAQVRDNFRADRAGVARRAGLSAEEVTEMEAIDLVGLELAATSLLSRRPGPGAQRGESG